ncbi:oligosaccharide flippase family protein [Klebsiella spallanzanii]|uniref:oligosaccharide flippase family protein n=1 Tax=Klebsiella spallanzanii TaxID=2587528 RepID=UPI0011594DF5|nr:oligosaccharide flippase family protein [Klebsiella spallanzanii]VUT02224.1 Putative O-antigen transporter [Klebsiella spallanzanii]
MVKKNIFLLVMVQVSTYIFPLLTLPYLVRILGSYGFGFVAIYLSVIQYVTMVIDFGFSFISVRKGAIVRDNKKELSKIYISTIVAKLIIYIVVASCCFIYISIIDSTQYEIYIYIAIITCFFSVFDSNWLFQVIEKLTFSSTLNILIKGLYVILVFSFVKNVDDIRLAILFSSIIFAAPGVYSVIYILVNKVIVFQKISYSDVFLLIKESFDIFISNITISLYTTLNTVILGFLAGPVYVAYFTGADKIKSAVQGFLNPVQQAIFPRVSRLMNDGASLKEILKIYGGKFILFGLFLTSGLFVFGYPFIKLYLGNDFITSAKLIIILSPLPFLISVAIVLGPWWMIAQGKSKLYRKIYMQHSLLHVLYAVPLIYYMPIYGIAISILLTELLIVIRFFINR